jgi:hypothetical protein
VDQQNRRAGFARINRLKRTPRLCEIDGFNLIDLGELRRGWYDLHWYVDVGYGVSEHDGGQWRVWVHFVTRPNLRKVKTSALAAFHTIDGCFCWLSAIHVAHPLLLQVNGNLEAGKRHERHMCGRSCGGSARGLVSRVNSNQEQ